MKCCQIWLLKIRNMAEVIKQRCGHPHCVRVRRPLCLPSSLVSFESWDITRQSLDEISCTFTDSKPAQWNPETRTEQSVTLQSCQRICHKRQRVLGLGFSRLLGHKWLLLLLWTSKILLWKCAWFAHTKTIHLNPTARVKHPGLTCQRCHYFVTANQWGSNRKYTFTLTKR